MKLGLVVGTRPNFVKAAALIRALSERGVKPVLIHTGQHHDAALSTSFFDRLGLPTPDHHLEVSRGSRAQQLGEIIGRLGKLLPTLSLDELIVVGDVTSTAAGALAADACDLPVSHVEAGLRSFDESMPEERNRKIVDALAKRLFASEPAGRENLLREGHPAERIHLVGNVMIDTLLRFRDQALASRVWERHGFTQRGYAVATLHRPGNVDDKQALLECVAILSAVSERWPVLFAVHPRTQSRLEQLGVPLPAGVRVSPPLDYLEFIGLMAGAAVVLTDSGGAQEETTVLGVPCLTMRENTERPITLSQGSSRLVGRSEARVAAAVSEIVDGRFSLGGEIAGWDGRAGARIADVLLSGR